VADFYVKMAAVATMLIAKFGTSIVVNKLATAPADPAKPWRGPEDPRSPLGGTAICSALRLGTQGQLGDLGKLINKADIPDEVETFYILEPGTTDLSDFDEAVVEGVTETIKMIVMIKPADTVLLWVLGTCK
jgi:hypothetical protein